MSVNKTGRKKIRNFTTWTKHANKLHAIWFTRTKNANRDGEKKTYKINRETWIETKTNRNYSKLAHDKHSDK